MSELPIASLPSVTTLSLTDIVIVETASSTCKMLVSDLLASLGLSKQYYAPNTTALVNMLSSISNAGGGIINLSPGVYDLTAAGIDMTNYQNILLCGSGNALTGLRWPDQTGTVRNTIDGAGDRMIKMGNGCGVFDLYLDGNKANQRTTQGTIYNDGCTGIFAQDKDGLAFRNVTVKNTVNQGFQLCRVRNTRLERCKATDTYNDGTHYGIDIFTDADPSHWEHPDGFFIAGDGGIDWSKNNVIKDCEAYNCGRDGMELMGKYCRVEGGTYNNNGFGIFPNHTVFGVWGAGGIYATQCDHTTITGVTANGNTETGVQMDSSGLITTHDNIITNCICEDNYDSGILVLGSDRTTVAYNIANNNGVNAVGNTRDTGIGIGGSGNVLVIGNHAHDTRSSGKTQMYGFSGFSDSGHGGTPTITNYANIATGNGTANFTGFP